MTNHLKRMRPHYFSISSPSTLNKKVARRHFADVMRQTRLGRLGLLPKDCYHYFSVLKSDSFLFDHEPEVIRGPFNAFFVLFFYFQKLMWMAPFLKPINKFICDQKSIPWKKNTLTTCLSRDRKRTVSQFYWRRNPCQKLKGCNQLSYLFLTGSTIPFFSTTSFCGTGWFRAERNNGQRFCNQKCLVWICIHFFLTSTLFLR